MDTSSAPRSFSLPIGGLLLVCLSALALASPALAQKKGLSGRFDLFAEGGGSFFTPGNVLTAESRGSLPTSYFLFTTSAHGTGRLFVGADYWLTHRDALQLSYSYGPASETTSLSFFPTASLPSYTLKIPQSVGAHYFSADYLRRFPLRSRWDWYLAAGIGTVHWQGAGYGTNNFATNVGTAVSYRFTRRWGLRVDYRDYTSRFFELKSLVNDQAPTIGPVFHF